MATKFEKEALKAIQTIGVQKETLQDIVRQAKALPDSNKNKTKILRGAREQLGLIKDVQPSLEILGKATKGSATFEGSLPEVLSETISESRAAQSMSGVQRGEYGADYGAGVRTLTGGGTDTGDNTGGSGDGSKGGGAFTPLVDEEAEKRRREGLSAYTLLLEEFSRYGLGALVEPLKAFIIEGLSPAEFTLRLRDTDAYKKRFAANAQRIAKGLSALSEAEYINLEDQYQNVMRQYGLPQSYYTRGDMGRQEGFEKFIAGDVSAAELEDRIQTAQNRVINAAPEIATSLKSFYPDITNGDILAYALDPEKALTEIKRKVTAAEIQGAANMAGLNILGNEATKAQIDLARMRAEELSRYGVTGEQARTGFRAVAEVAPRGSQLAEFYRQSPYTQTTAEQEVFGLTGATEAARQRKKLTELEQASFSGSAGTTGGALARDRAGAF